MDYQISDSAYKESLKWLFSQLPMFSRVGAAAYKPGLENTLELDRLFKHPHRSFKSIHIGGTNGKGSTSHMIASILQAQGYKTGLYTSPHLVDFRERMRINGKMIPREEVMKFIENWRSKDSDIKPSFFELTMMMAFDWFARERVDYAVIEVGMGGRLDSTNIITPILSVITNISYDHTQFLGDTLEKIAYEKAGIIKNGIPVVVGEASGSVKEVFIRKADSEESPAIFAEEHFNENQIKKTPEGWKIQWSENRVLEVPLAGEYQKKNINTVLHAIRELQNSGLIISDKSIDDGLRNVSLYTGLAGRWQKIMEKPVVICDTGHNLAGITSSLKSLRMRYPGIRVKFVLGFVNDKDVSHIVNLFPKDADYYFSQASIPRAMPVEEVEQHFKSAGISGAPYLSVEEAYKAALRSSGPDDIIYIGGSTFIVADFLQTQS